jgi:hypothetical protein
VTYTAPQIKDLGLIAAHTFMPDPGASASNKGFSNALGDFDCELSHSGFTPVGLCGSPHPGH